ncbi:Importin alpha subunit (Karyopherin alpha subunit) (Serine-rich RNA polymerase I suppressor protein) [Cladochytrium tenue]|nr:Importin alpha subunit (Karyopherin alpha subunit) (Serine-rich RNA polymerase I suppressor protein) [Cladochytrium tenue]
MLAAASPSLAPSSATATGSPALGGGGGGGGGGADRRLAAYKNRGQMKADEFRRRREEETVELRRQKKEESMAKRRTVAHSILDDDDDADADAALAAGVLVSGGAQDLAALIQAVNSHDPAVYTPATAAIRKILSKGKSECPSLARNPPIQDVIDSGIVPRLVSFLRSPDGTLQFEAAWALTNIASGSSSQTQTVLENNAVPVFVELLSSPNVEVREQAVWALGNIAGDSARCRDYVLGCGALGPMLEILRNPVRPSMARNATWTLSNFCRGKNPYPDWNVVRPALGALETLLYSNDEEVLIDACWALSYVSDGANDKIQAVIEARVVPRLVQLLQHSSPAVQTPALRTIGNIVTGDDAQTQYAIDHGVLPALGQLMASPKDNIRKEACWTISNITAGNSVQIDAVIDANLIPPLINILQTGEFKSRKEACWAISNATSGGLAKPDQIRHMVTQGCIKPLCDVLHLSDNKIVSVALDGLENILKVGDIDRPQHDGVNVYADHVEAAGGLNMLCELQQHSNEDIYKKCYQLIDKYFNDEDEDGLDTSQQIDESGNFTFGGADFAAQQQQAFRF